MPTRRTCLALITLLLCLPAAPARAQGCPPPPDPGDPMMGQGPPGYLPPPAGGPDDHSYAGGSGGGGGFTLYNSHLLAPQQIGEFSPRPMGTLAIAAALRFGRDVTYSVPAISYGNYELGLDVDVAPILGRFDGFALGVRLDLTGERREMVEQTLGALRSYKSDLDEERRNRERGIRAPEMMRAARRQELFTRGDTSNQAYNRTQLAWRTSAFANYREFPEISTRVTTAGLSFSRLYPTDRERLRKHEGPTPAWGIQGVVQGHHASLPGDNHSAVNGGVRLTWQDAVPQVRTTMNGETLLYRWHAQLGVEYVTHNALFGGDAVSGFIRLRSRGRTLKTSNYKELTQPYWEYSLSVGKGPDDRVFGGVRLTYVFGLR